MNVVAIRVLVKVASELLSASHLGKPKDSLVLSLLVYKATTVLDILLSAHLENIVTLMRLLENQRTTNNGQATLGTNPIHNLFDQKYLT